jgi:hypothetical protein
MVGQFHRLRTSGRALFRGHNQPRVPLGQRYYDLSEMETLRWQVATAKQYGLHGFCHYHYWFDGIQLLEKPTNLMLEAPELDFPFCLAWANETWSRRWDGRDHHILQKQTHHPDPALWKRHFEYLFRAWSDDRAIKVDGKPLFLVYRAHLIQQLPEMFDLWRELAHRRGLPGLFLATIKQYEFPFPELLRHFDAVVQFQPFEALYSPDFEAATFETRKALAPFRLLPEKIQDILRAVRYQYFPRLTFYDYDMVWKHMLKVEREGGIPAFPGAFVDWDNTARYVKRARIFGRLARALSTGSAAGPGHGTRPAPSMIFMNAWNEWAEGTYRARRAHGYRYLEAVRNRFTGGAPAARSPWTRVPPFPRRRMITVVIPVIGARPDARCLESVLAARVAALASWRSTMHSGTRSPRTCAFLPLSA